VNAGRSLARETSAGDRHCSRQAQAARPRLSLKPKPRGAKPRGGGPASTSNRGREVEVRRPASRRRARKRGPMCELTGMRRRPPYRVSTSRARAPGASGARERTLGEGDRLRLPGLGACSQDEPVAHGGIGRSRGRARGLFGLQKSTSGAWSRSRGHGSSLLALLREAQRAKQRRKPDRSGESHEHASSDTGDKLLVIPRAYGESPKRRGRENASMEGALIQRGRRL